LLPEDKYCGFQWSYDLKTSNQDSSKFPFWAIFHEKEAGNIPEKLSCWSLLLHRRIVPVTVRLLNNKALLEK